MTLGCSRFSRSRTGSTRVPAGGPTVSARFRLIGGLTGGSLTGGGFARGGGGCRFRGGIGVSVGCFRRRRGGFGRDRQRQDLRRRVGPAQQVEDADQRVPQVL